MKKILIFVKLLLMIFILISCNKGTSNNNNNGTNNTSSKDTSLLFALNISSSKFSDSSYYNNTCLVANSISKIVNNALEFGTDDSSIYTINPYFLTNLPANKISKNVTIFTEIRNSITTYPSIYSDSSCYYSNLILGSNSTVYSTNFNKNSNLSLNLERVFYGNNNYGGNGELLSFKTINDACGADNTSLGQSGNISTNLYFDITSIKKTKICLTVDGNIISLYQNGILIYQVSNYQVALNKCDISNFYYTVIRGTLLSNLKIWNRTLSLNEIANL